ncbi:S8 family peptidase [Halorussus lipolyticus]|uniref:S8 family peptidase n=1 Tax=Halorussus lipolyticus TaxID=3034024 RepID=UPI0023E89985|nr:S8 family peptidase [Halorussus sp. DT80]
MSDYHQFGRRRFLEATGGAGAAALVGTGGAVAGPGRSPGPKESEILVGVSAGRDLRGTVEPHVPAEAEIAHENRTLRYLAVGFPAEDAEEARRNFAEEVPQVEGVKYVEENATHRTQLTPNDPQFGSQYAPKQVRADDAWDITQGCSDVTVAVIDTGCQYDHPDLKPNFASNPGRDFVDNDSDPYPDAPADEYHGSIVAGLACGATDNGEGIAGIGNCTLINGRALDENGSGSTADIADAIMWAADEGADIINMSFGGGGYTETMKNAVSYAANQDCLMVCAAGNDGSSTVSYPAAYSECMAISAVDSSENLASFSQYGSSVDLCAPGVDILSTTTETRGSYERFSGTSMATPVVSGVACLTLCQWDSLTSVELRTHLKETAKDIGLSSDKQGAGQVNAYNAVTTDPNPIGTARGDSVRTTISDSLTGSSDYDDWEYTWEFDNPSEVTVELSGPSDADFDLYINTGTTLKATPSNADYSVRSPGSQEQVLIENPDDSTPMQIDVDSYSGSGSYDLTITEYE